MPTEYTKISSRPGSGNVSAFGVAVAVGVGVGTGIVATAVGVADVGTPLAAVFGLSPPEHALKVTTLTDNSRNGQTFTTASRTTP
jgi:hypothetical protein